MNPCVRYNLDGEPILHCLIVGMTESGKSCLGKIMAKELVARKQPVVVLDPLCDPSWEATFITENPEKFSDYLRKNRSVFAFVDEGGGVFNEGRDATHAWFTTKSRHYGHSVTLISQRAMQIPRTMRDQCHRLYLFTSSLEDGKIHADEWNKPVLKSCHTLPQFEFLAVSRYGKCDRMRVVEYTRIEPAPATPKPVEPGKKPFTRRVARKPE